MLAKYLAETTQILQNPSAPQSLYTSADLITYINRGRLQLAGDSEAIRVYGTLALIAGQQQYAFSAISTGSTPGVAGVFNCRTAWYRVGTGQRWFRPRSFEWFSLYELNDPVPGRGAPKTWSQFGQGTAGTLFVAPIPDQAYVCPVDLQCYPVDLVDDTTPEAIPDPWREAVPYFAAYLAYLSAQSPARQGDAQRMMSLYTEFLNRARRFSNPSVLPGLYAQAPNPVRMNQLGLAPQRSAGGG